MSIVDTVVTDCVAFLDDRRVCVMFTRAKKMQFIIAGTFDNVDSTTWKRTVRLPNSNPKGAKPREVTKELTAPLLYYRNYYQSEKKAFVEVEGLEVKVSFVPDDLKQPHGEEEVSNKMDTTANGNTSGSWGSVEATDQPPLKWPGDGSTDKTSKPTDKASKSTDKASKSTDKTSKSTEDKIRTPNCSHR